ncbi:fusion protein [Bat paramyxovirus]|uniref:fusion protein n=1 Tax=Bat paramyxovirus TaxID=1300978 RepID=UPI0005FCA3EA|nr:fusion protein [Bat paramyxovirus]AIF74189.1 fusion protein [Bat paramyxovirus]
MSFKMLMIALIMGLAIPIESQISFTQLSKIGVIKARNYKLKIRGRPVSQPIVLKLIPNLSNMTQCNDKALQDYKKMLDKIVKPIDESLKIMQAAITERTGNAKFWGAVIGGVALGVATSAQITAGIALHNSIENAKAVLQVKDAITEATNAITELKLAGEKTVVALSALQDQINTQIVPSINTLGCQVAANTLALRLTQYFSEISLVFGPNLRNPAAETLSIQALSRAFNGDFDSILKTLGYTNEDFLDILESNSIRVRIIAVDTSDYLIIMQVEYPTLTEMTDAVIQTFNLISFNNQGSEWVPLFPREVLVRLGYLSNIDVSNCAQTSKSYICSEDTSSPMSFTLLQCIAGDTSKCIATRNVNSQVPRYALSEGVLFANCVPIICQCHTTEQTIIQEAGTSNVMITKKDCAEVYIDGFFITLGDRKLNRTMYADDYQIGDQVSIDPIDIGSDISQIQGSLNKTQDFIDKTMDILSKVNPDIITTSKFVYLLVISVVLIVWVVVTLGWLCYLTKVVLKLDEVRMRCGHTPTVSSLSSLIQPRDY